MAPPNFTICKNEQIKQHQLTKLSNWKIYNLVEKDDSNNWYHTQHPLKEKPIGEASSRPQNYKQKDGILIPLCLVVICGYLFHIPVAVWLMSLLHCSLDHA